MNFLGSIAKFLGFDVDQTTEKKYHQTDDLSNNTNFLSDKFQNFVPKPELIYCYFFEENISDEYVLASKNESFQVYYVSDIQRFCYYKRQDKICTFMGFCSSIELLLGIKSPVLKKHKLYKYLNTRDKIKPFNFQEFSPNNNLIYYFFIEKSVSQNLKSEFNFASDIQRFRYFPGTKNNFTFIGFTNSILFTKKIAIMQTIFKLTIDKENVYIYESESSQPTNDLNQRYTNKLNQNSANSLIKNTANNLHQNASSLHQNANNLHQNAGSLHQNANNNLHQNAGSLHQNANNNLHKNANNNLHQNANNNIHQNTNNNLHQNSNNNLHQNASSLHQNANNNLHQNANNNLHQNANNNLHQNANNNIHQNTNNLHQNDTNNLNQIAANNLIRNPVNNMVKNSPNDLNKKDGNNLNKKERIDQNAENKTPKLNNNKMFNPISYYYYLYFQEISVKNYKNLGLSDIQHNRLHPQTLEKCTFIGFFDKNRRDQVIDQRLLISNSLNRRVFKFSNADDNEQQKDIVNPLNIFWPYRNLFYFCFDEKENPFCEILKNASDIQRNCLYMKTNLLLTYVGFLTKEKGIQTLKESDLNLNKIYTFSHENSTIETLNNYDLIEDNQPIISKFNYYFGSNSVFKVFIPIDNIFYCYFTEIQHPSASLANKKYNNIFGIKNASDIQRFAYYPKSQLIFTFIGFANKSKLMQNISKASLKSSAFNQKICIFHKNYKINLSKSQEINKDQNNEEKNQDQGNEEENIKKEKNQFDQVQDNESANIIQETKQTNQNNNEIANKEINQNSKLADRKRDEKQINQKNESTNKEQAEKRININRNNTRTKKNKETKQVNQNHLNQNNKSADKKQINQNKNNETESITTNQFNNNTENKSKDVKQVNQNQSNESTVNSKTNQKTFFWELKKISNTDNSKSLKIKNSKLFSSDESLYYLYFKEKRLNCQNYICKNSELFGILNINEIQRGFKINQDDHNYYTFFGFLHSFDRNLAFNSLQKEKTLIDVDSLKMIDDENDTDGCEKEKENNDQKNSHNYLQSNLSSSKFRYTPPPPSSPNINSFYETIKQTPSNNDNNIKQKKKVSRFVYTPSDNENIKKEKDNEANDKNNKNECDNKINNMNSNNDNSNKINDMNSNESIINDKNSKNENINDKIINNNNDRFHFSYAQNEEEIQKNHINEPSQQQTVTLLLPKFKKFKNSFNYSTFIPKNGLVYFFFAEINEPSFRVFNKNATKLFGIKNAADIQRFHYYPNSKCIYTFIGFLDKKSMQQATWRTSIKSNAVNQAIFDYPYKSTELQPTLNDIEQKSNESHLNLFKVDLINTNIINSDKNDNNNSDDKNKNSAICLKYNDDYDKKINSNLIDASFNNNADFDDNENVHLDDNKILFCPDEDLYYIYFIEKDKKIKNCRDLKPDLFGVHNIKDLWRGYRINTADLNFYTFLGFSHSIDLNAAINVLQKQSELIDTSNIQKLDQKEDSDDYDDNGDNDNDDIFSDDDFDEIESYSEDVLHNISMVNKVSPDEIIRFNS